MEEKERYLYIPDEYECAESYIYDNNNDNEYNDLKSICNLLNQQSKRIKELEQENEKLFAEAYFKSCEYCQNKIVKENVVIKEESNKLFEENQQLKQQLHDLPKKIVEEVKENFDWRQCCEIRKYYDQQYIWFNYVAFNDFLDTILKKVWRGV